LFTPRRKLMDNVSPWWVAAAVPVTVALVAGINAWYKSRVDKRLGIAASETAEEDADANRWRSMIETQTKALLEPLQKTLAEHAEKIRMLEAELDTTKRKYWQSITHIRGLNYWIDRNVEMQPTMAPRPQPPASLVEDI
jgi:hypothetical protein